MDKDYSRTTEKVRNKEIKKIEYYFSRVSLTYIKNGIAIRKITAPTIKIAGRPYKTENVPANSEPIT